MRFEDIETDLRRGTRRQIQAALLVALVVVGGLGAVATQAQISGAVIGIGKVIVAGRAKDVQHAEGGTVSEILVQEGQRVHAGQPLFRLDGTVAEASLNIIDSELQTLLAQEARLMTEQARLDGIVWPPEVTEDASPRTRLLIEGQNALFVSRRDSRESRKGQYREQMGQYAEQIAALEAQKGAVAENLTLIGRDLTTAQTLHDRGLIVESALSALRREHASLMGSQSSVAAEIAETARGVTAAALAMAEVDEQFDEAVLTELDKTRREIAKLRQEHVGAQDRLSRLEIRAPFDGVLHEMAVHTVGGVIGPGERLVRVIPMGERLLVEARIAPVDIEQVHPGQMTRLRMTALNTRLIPELPGRVLDVTADLSTDQMTGQTFYTARIEIEPEGLAMIDTDVLRPGMPVEALVETRRRNIAEYIMEPITEQLRHAMRES